MAVQAQHPSNILLNSSTLVTSQKELRLQSADLDLSRAYDSAGLKSGCYNSPGLLLNETTCHLAATRKRQRQCDTSSKQSPSVSNMDLGNNFDPLTEELKTQFTRQRQEIDDLVKIHGGRMKRIMEEKSRRHYWALFYAFGGACMKLLKEKEFELEDLNQRNMELEERVKRLSLEAQLWQILAKNNEIVACNLRASLDQAVAQSGGQSRAKGCGESDVDDAESCTYGEARNAQVMKENKELRKQRLCRVCSKNDVCILLLPCRHLCLCKECEATVDECPLCGSAKHASVQVHMSHTLGLQHSSPMY